MTSTLYAALASAALSLPLVAQNTATVTIGDPDGQGCQSMTAPTLTGGVPASATFDFAYDRATAMLTLTVTNTSPIVGNDDNPVLSEFYLNLPAGAVTGASLVSQSGSGGATAAFSLGYGADAFHANCFGGFDVLISSGSGPRGGIANASAPYVGGPPGSTVTGPVEFVIQLAGPGVSNINAYSIAFGYSSNGARANVNVAGKFVAGGPSGDESGMVASGDDCDCGSWLTAEARIGTTFELCQNGQAGCHDCLWVSLNAGPTSFGPPFNLTANIGFPLIAVLDFDFPANNEICLPITLPNDQNLVGRTLYFEVVTHPNPLTSPADIGFCGAFQFTIVN